MNLYYDNRMVAVSAVYRRIRNFFPYFMLVNELAYNPEAVDNKSSVEILGVTDYTTLDFDSLRASLGITDEVVPRELIMNRVINMLKLYVPNNRNLEIKLDMWDKSAFENVVNLIGPNVKFKQGRRVDMLHNLTSLRGEKALVSEIEPLDGGLLITTSPYYERSGDCYVSPEVTKLLLKPKIVNGFEHHPESDIDELKGNLKGRFAKAYGLNREGVSLLNTLPLHVREKLTPELKRKLETFF